MFSIYNSKDCVHWGLLPPATDEMIEKAKLAKGRFTGDPSFEFEHTEVKKIGEGEEATEEEETVSQTYGRQQYIYSSLSDNSKSLLVFLN